MMADQDQLNLGLLIVAVFLVVLVLLWGIRRSRAGRVNRVSASRTAPEASSAAPFSEFTMLYDDALTIPKSPRSDGEIEPSNHNMADLDQAPEGALFETAADGRPAPDTATGDGAWVLNDFRKALDDGMDLPSAARKHGLTEDEARVVAFCYSPPDS
ncbi:MAG: hypothetical protein NXH84_08650 [Rhodobacteraceae bacterium]|nr:hypothetical protein [Paracoccaceae bacterium]